MVRPTGVYYSPVTKALVWLATPNRKIGIRQAAGFLASIFGLERDANLPPALTTNAIEVRHG